MEKKVRIMKEHKEEKNHKLDQKIELSPFLFFYIYVFYSLTDINRDKIFTE